MQVDIFMNDHAALQEQYAADRRAWSALHTIKVNEHERELLAQPKQPLIEGEPTA